MQTIEYNRDTILLLYTAFLDEGLSLRRDISELSKDLYMPQLGGDPVSSDARDAFTHKLRGAPDSIVKRSLEHADNLIQTAHALKEVAKTYGYTEEHIEASFKSILPGLYKP
ncbi:hypothetical protein [Allokutzneria oryzae]|uniref:Uncharacterized protein n=1 Tax=Allokutzneria oryzae TaxID=1378989 RepID=A0ABV5ZR24_9PSEU